MIQPVHEPKSVEVAYRRELDKLVRRLADDVQSQIVPLLKLLEPEYKADTYAQTLEQAFENLRRAYAGIAVEAKSVASRFVGASDNKNKDRFYRSLKGALGVDLASVVQNEGLTDTLTAATARNVNLIKSIPDEYFKKIENLVFTNTVEGSTAGGLIREIQKINGQTLRRAKLIARDQTSKLNADLNKARQENLGVTEYVWRTAEDGRVRDTHAVNNGKIFRWDRPPASTGHPGHDVNCRCVAQPIIKV